MPTSEVTLKRFGKHPALLVKRFDRRYDVTSNRVLRKHVIDGCQALNLPRDYKYERNLGDGRDVKHIRDVVMFDQFKHTLAMAVGNEFEPDTINAYQLATLPIVASLIES